jgi:F-type H+-transporting ATPase subunit delta
MKKRVLVKRYAQGFLKSIKDEKEHEALYQELLGFHELLTTHDELQGILLSPFLPTSKKVELAEDLLTKLSYQGKNLRFILLLIDNGRFQFFPEILESMPEFWNELKGVSTYEVTSAVPLTEDQKKRLIKKLERLEKKPIFLKYRKDPSLIGGISIQKGHVVYDASVKGNLERLKQLIIEG